VSRPDRPVGDDDLQALIDGRLSPERQQVVRAFLAERPEMARRVEAQRDALDAMRSRLGFKLDEPIPVRLRISNITAAERDRRNRRTLVAALTCLWLLLGGVGGWFANDFFGPDMLSPGLAARWAAMARDAIAAHRAFASESVHPVEVKASEQAHLTQWFAKRLGRNVPVPDFIKAGFRLMGGRILPAGQEVAAQLMYDDEQGVRLTFYIRTGEIGEGELTFMRRGEVQAFYWVDDGCGYVLSGAVDRRRLREAAELAFRQLEEPADKND
jgi:anti-sigma factor RsiW